MKTTAPVPTRRRRVALATALVAVILLPGVAGARSPLEPSVRREESYSETYTVIADLQDGTYVQAQLMITNVGWGDQHGICRLLVAPHVGKAWTRARKVSRKKWRFEDGPVPSLTVGDCSISGGTSVVVEMALEGAHLHMRLDAPLASVAPPGHLVRVDSGLYSSDILVPHAQASVRVTLPGQPELTLTGNGYADHSVCTAEPRSLGRQWVRFRGLDGPCSTLLLARQPPNGAPAQGWVWPAGAEGPSALQAVRLRVPDSHARGDDAFVMVESARKVYRLAPYSRVFRHAPFEEHGFLGALVSRFVGNPVTETYRAVLRDAGRCGDVPGILEVTNVYD